MVADPLQVPRHQDQIQRRLNEKNMGFGAQIKVKKERSGDLLGHYAGRLLAVELILPPVLEPAKEGAPLASVWLRSGAHRILDVKAFDGFLETSGSDFASAVIANPFTDVITTRVAFGKTLIESKKTRQKGGWKGTATSLGLTFDDFIEGTEKFGTRIQPLMKSRAHVRSAESAMAATATAS